MSDDFAANLAGNFYVFAKAVHIIGFVSWFAGLFYVVRLFIYHTEALEKPEPEREILHKQFTLMERKLWLIITTPAMIITVLFGSHMAAKLISGAGWANVGWLHAKIPMLVGLIGYHHICGRIRKQLARGEARWTSVRLRLWNELATLLLVAIVMVAVFRGFDALWGTLGLVAFGMILGVAVKLVRRRARQAS